jgi:carbonic anhydrase/acetyltransferase-like protein (isoleucine patch superfamily)
MSGAGGCCAARDGYDTRKGNAVSDPPVTDSPPAPPVARPDMAAGLRGFVSLDALVRLLLWCGAFTAATAILARFGAWPADSLGDASLAQAWHWAWRLAAWILLFNYAYVLELIVLRLPIPTPREGRYPITRRRPPLPVLWSCLIAVLTKARYEAPFPGFLVFHVANLPPLSWLMGPIFGPRSRSCYVTDPRIIDPHFVTIGRNVVIGIGATVAGHYQDRDAVVLRRTVIEDDVVIGGHAAVGGGVHLQRGAVIGAGAIVLPETVVGPNEYWSGVPARRLRTLPPLDAAPQAT